MPLERRIEMFVHLPANARLGDRLLCPRQAQICCAFGMFEDRPSAEAGAEREGAEAGFFWECG
jgi:hypothetical protein